MTVDKTAYERHKKIGFDLIKNGNCTAFQEHIERADLEPSKPEQRVSPAPQLDCKDFLNYALTHRQKDIVLYLLAKDSFLISKELFYVYALPTNKHSGIALHCFDKIFDQFNKIDGIQDRKILQALQIALIEFASQEITETTLETFKTSCIALLKKPARDNLSNNHCWKEIFNNILAAINKLKLVLLGPLLPAKKRRLWQNSLARPAEILQETATVIGLIQYSTFCPPQEKKIETEAYDANRHRSLKAQAIDKLLNDTQAFIRLYKESTYVALRYYCSLERKLCSLNKEYLNNAIDQQDFLNLALAHQNKQAVRHLQEIGRDFIINSLDRPLFISKDLFYQYSYGKLSDEAIHSFDTVFSQLDILRLKIIDLASRNLPLDKDAPFKNPVCKAYLLLLYLQNRMLFFVDGQNHQQKDIDELKAACIHHLKTAKQSTLADHRGWGEVIFNLQKAIKGFGFGYLVDAFNQKRDPKINRFSFHTPTDTEMIIDNLSQEFDNLSLTR